METGSLYFFVPASHLTPGNAFNSPFQGLLVATLLCFCNQEVHAAWRANSQRLAYTVGLPQGTTRSSERPRSRGRGPSTPEPDSDLALKTASAWPPDHVLIFALEQRDQ